MEAKAELGLKPKLYTECNAKKQAADQAKQATRLSFLSLSLSPVLLPVPPPPTSLFLLTKHSFLSCDSSLSHHNQPKHATIEMINHINLHCKQTDSQDESRHPLDLGFGHKNKYITHLHTPVAVVL